MFLLHVFYLYLSANLERMIHNIVTYGLTMETHWEISHEAIISLGELQTVQGVKLVTRIHTYTYTHTQDACGVTRLS